MKRTIALISCLALLLCLFAGCGKTEETTPAAADTSETAAAPEAAETSEAAEASDTGLVEKKTPEGTFVLGLNAEPNSLDPAGSFGDSFYEYFAGFNTLITYDFDTGEFSPSLATDWVWEDDLTVTFTLRDDVYFHEGEHMTAEDVLFSIQRFTTSFFHSDYVQYVDFDASHVNDDYSVTFVLTDTCQTFMNFLSSPYASILCKSWVEENGEDALSTQMNGTGMFKLSEWSMGDSITMVKNDNYWGGEAGYDTLVLRFISEDTTRFIAFQNGELDAILKLAGSDIDRINAGEIDGVEMTVKKAPECITLLLNHNNEALSDLRVRQAIAHAINYEDLNEAVYGSGGEVATEFIPYEMLGHGSVDGYSYDPELAKELLEEAGYGDGLSLIGMCASDTTDTQILEIVQMFLADVGIDMSVDAVDASVQVMAQINGDMDIGKGANMATGGDTFELFASMTDSSNLVAGTTDETLLTMIREAICITDPDERDAAYQQIDQYIYDNVICIPLSYRVWGFACWNYVDGFDTPPTGLTNPTTVTFK